MQDLMEKACEIVLQSRRTIALTGAGISVESGIPDFRSAGGLWSRYDPAEYATIDAFVANPEKVWNMLREMGEVVGNAKPNKAHIGLGRLEKAGYLHCVITQNVDNLHQEGGATNVIEYHGNSSTLSCLRCRRRYRAEDKRGEHVPRCECGRVLKPDVVFFGEGIPAEAMSRSYQYAATAEALMVIGTSAVVAPVNSLPFIAKERGAKIIEINMERTHLTNTITDVFLQGGAGEIVSRLVDGVLERQGPKG
jgi:NAD-dependent deacetylase